MEQGSVMSGRKRVHNLDNGPESFRRSYREEYWGLFGIT